MEEDNFKKPRFWIVIISVIVGAVVAVCSVCPCAGLGLNVERWTAEILSYIM